MKKSISPLRQAPNGVEKWSWDKESRTLKGDWTVLGDLQSALYPVSESSNAVALALFKDGEYSLLAVDWAIGKELGKTILGNSPIFNTMGGLFIPIDDKRTYVTGVFEPVMITKPSK